jgi:hypothetical protein
MGIFFTVGETKKRPGIYQRYENIGGTAAAGASNGIAAAVIKANWGPCNTVVTMSSDSEISKYFGTSGTTQVLHELFTGGATTVRAVRAGSDGTSGSITLKDSGSTPANAITITLKSPGSRQFRYTLRDSLSDTTKREFVLYDGTTAIEKIMFTLSADGEVDALIMAASSSTFMAFAKVSSYVGTGKLASIGQTDFTAGTDPTVTNESYANAFSLLESYRFNTICVDTNDISVHAMLQGFVDRIYEDGKMCLAVVGEPAGVDYATRLSHSVAYNDYRTIYFGSGWTDSSGNTYDGFLAVARISGMVAAIASNSSLSHKVITGAVSPIEMLTNTQFDDAVDHGMMVLSINTSGQLWIDYAITTLATPSGEDDAGWKKIRRVKTRFELMQRSSDTTENMVGNINNDTDGRTAVKQAVQGILNTMVSEGKLLPGATISDDTSNVASGDSAWFVITADDIDSLEKMYFTFQFRFSSAS